MTTPTDFVRDQWYVVASTDEISDIPLARTVCGEHIVLFRQTDGTIVALADRCPHRGYPLSLGAVDCVEKPRFGVARETFGQLTKMILVAAQARVHRPPTAADRPQLVRPPGWRWNGRPGCSEDRLWRPGLCGRDRWRWHPELNFDQVLLCDPAGHGDKQLVGVVIVANALFLTSLARHA